MDEYKIFNIIHTKDMVNYKINEWYKDKKQSFVVAKDKDEAITKLVNFYPYLKEYTLEKAEEFKLYGYDISVTKNEEKEWIY